MDKYRKCYNVILDNMDLNRYRLRPISAIMYLQDAFARYTATKKMAAYDLFSTNQYWVVAEFNMEFSSNLPFWSEEIMVEIWISEISKLKVYTDFKIYWNNEVFTKGNSLWFVIDKETRRPAKTDMVSERFKVCNELTLGEHKKFLIPESVEKYKEITHTINLSDLDFNNHVNNKSYINIAEMTIPDEFRKSHILKNLHVRFNKETFLNDVLNCSTYKTETPDIYTHKIEENGVSVCDIVSEWKTLANDIDILNYDLKVKKRRI